MGVLTDPGKTPLMEDHGASAVTRPITVRWEAWALLAAAAGAVAVGTIVRGFIGSDWFFNTDNLANSAPLALPFLIAAGVVIGAGRWPGAGRELGVGAILLACSGVLTAVTGVLLAMVTTSGGLVDLNDVFLPLGIVTATALTFGYAALAIALWDSAPGELGAGRTMAAIGVGIVTLAAAAGPLVTTATTTFVGDGFAVYLLGAGMTSASVAALGALAVAAVLAIPNRTPVPELLIAAGATLDAVIDGGTWWLLATMQGDGPAFELLTFAQPVGNVASLVLAAGFASGALFWPVED
jgi:hypothetical protein